MKKFHLVVFQRLYSVKEVMEHLVQILPVFLFPIPQFNFQHVLNSRFIDVVISTFMQRKYDRATVEIVIDGREYMDLDGDGEDNCA